MPFREILSVAHDGGLIAAAPSARQVCSFREKRDIWATAQRHRRPRPAAADEIPPDPDRGHRDGAGGGGGRRRDRGQRQRRAPRRGGRSGQGVDGRIQGRRADVEPDQARGGAVRRERVVRPLLRHVPVRDEHGRDHVQGQAGHAQGQRAVQQDHLEWPDRPAADGQRERVQPQAPHPLPGTDLRPEPRLHAGAASVRRRQDGQVRPVHRDGHVHGTADPVRRAGPGHGLLRRQHRHRAVELRPELRDERQQLRHPVRAVDPGRAQRDLR